MITLFGCGKKEKTEVETILEEANEYPYIKVEDDVAIVVLKENRTTNCIWKVYCPDELKLTIDEYVTNENKKNLVGVGGRHIYKFEGIANFTGEIKYEETTHSGTVYPDSELIYIFENGKLVK